MTSCRLQRLAGCLCGLALFGGRLLGQPVPNVVQWGVIEQAGLHVPAEATNVVAASIFGYSAAAIRADGSLVAWGWEYPAPDLPHPSDVQAVSVGAWTYGLPVSEQGEHYGFAVTGGAIVPWGWDHGLDFYNPARAVTNAVAVAAGNGLPVLALLSDHTVVPLNFPDTTPSPTDWTNIVAVAAAFDRALALRADGTLAYALFATSGSWPQVPPGLTNVVAAAAGGVFDAALRADGTVVAWGGASAALVTNVPPDLTNAVAIAAGDYHCLALRANGHVAEWGYNRYEGPWASPGPTNVPSSLSNVVSIAAGGESSLAVIGTGMPPRHIVVTNMAFGPGGFSALVPTDRGKVYALEYKDSLSDAQWQLLPLVAGTGGMVQLVDKSATLSQRFYRVRRW